MKKKFLAIVSLLVAIVMSFALIACNEAPPSNGPGNNSEKPPVTSGITVGKLNDAFDALTNLDNGYKATLSFNATTAKNSVGAAGELAFEKRGSRIKTTLVEEDGEVDIVLDLATGFVYNTNNDGKYTTDGQPIPAGFVEYVGKAIADVDMDENTVIKNENGVSFDEATKTFTVAVDLKDTVNTVITPLIDAYTNNSTAKKLINDYIALYDETLDIDRLLNTGIELIVGIKDTTIGALLTQAQISLEDVLAQAGVEFDAQMLTIIKNRKVGDAIMGALEFVENNMESIMMTGEFDVEELLSAILVAEVDNSGLKTKLDAYKDTLLGLLEKTKVREFVDKLAGVGTEDGLINNSMFAGLYCVLTDEIKVDKLAAQLTVVFDDSYRITKLAGKADFAHTYNGTEITTGLFSDNAYHADFELKVSDYTATAEAWTLECASESDDIENVMVITDGSEDCNVYCEFFGKDVTVSNLVGVYMCEDRNGVLATTIKFDADKSSIVIPKAAFDEAKKKSGFTGNMGISAKVTVTEDGESYNYMLTVAVMGVTDDHMGYLQELVSQIIGGMIEDTTPPESNVGSGNATLNA